MSLLPMFLASRCCAECLTTPSRIVSGARAAEVIADVRASGTHFICHKGSIAGVNLHCRGVHDRFPSRAYRFALAMGIPVVELDPDALAEGQPIPKPGGDVPGANEG
jgi:hypothetical protein